MATRVRSSGGLRGARLPRVIVAVNAVRGYGERVIDGLIAYADRHARWQFLYAASDAPAVVFRRFRDEADAAIGLGGRELAEPMRAWGKPVVLVQENDFGLPAVVPDDAAIGRMAFEHLAGRGFQRFSMLAHRGEAYSDAREVSFASAVAAAGLVYDRCEWSVAELRHRGFVEWLRSVAKPVAVFCANAGFAHGVAAACLRAGVRVPDEVAILGVDNDRRLCKLSRPPLSTIDHNTERIGFEAAGLLDRLMRGGRAPASPIRVPPLEVIVRQSTDTFAADDAALVAAVRYIRDRACDGIEVADVLRHVPVARRTLEQSFRQRLDRGIREEIVRVRLAEVKRLLVRTDLPMPDICARAGFSSASKLSTVFRKAVGQTPREYRAAHHAQRLARRAR